MLQLNNKDYYQSLYHKPKAEFNKKILQALRKAVLSELITEEVALVLFNDNLRTSTFYTSQNWTFSVYVDDNIKHFSKLVPLRYMDTTCFFQIIRQLEITEDLFCFCRHFKNFHQHHTCRRNMKYCMIEIDIREERATFISKLASLVLKHNYFEFDNKIYCFTR